MITDSVRLLFLICFTLCLCSLQDIYNCVKQIFEIVPLLLPVRIGSALTVSVFCVDFFVMNDFPDVSDEMKLPLQTAVYF